MIQKLTIMMLAIMMVTLYAVHHPFTYAQPPKHEDQITIAVRVSDKAKYETKITLTDGAWIRDIIRAKDREPIKLVPICDAYLLLQHEGRSKSYLIDGFGYLIDQEALIRILLPESRRIELLRQVQLLRERHYGRLTTWDEANKLLPNKAIFVVLDLETGLNFRVQRRAGSSHADVQPLTKLDTQIMKRIYNGRWSWKRRAILVSSPEEMLLGNAHAASMHGMPHGGDGIPDNDFSGHFCIHFMDSRTHGSGRVDFDHQLMVLKAAVMLERFYLEASPVELVHSFFSGLNQQDEWLLNWCFSDLDHPQAAFFKELMSRIASVRVQLDTRPDHNFTQEIACELIVEADVYYEDKGLDEQIYHFHLTRLSYTSPWKIDHVSLVS